MPQIARSDETMKHGDADGHMACAPHVPRCAYGQSVVDDDDRGPCATCAEIERMVRDREVPY